MVNQAFRIKIAYRSKKKKENEENTRDRSVPDGSDKKMRGEVHILVLTLCNGERRIVQCVYNLANVVF